MDVSAIFSGMTSSITYWDLSILRLIHRTFSSSFLDTVMPIISAIDNHGEVWILIALLLLISKKTRKTGAAIGVALVLGLVVGNGLLKNLIMRPRPFETLGRLLKADELLIAAPTDYSFPSGHALSSMAAATAIFRDHTLLGAAAYVLALLISFSRLYLYVHYPTDIIGGMIIGILCGLLGCKIVWFFDEKIISPIAKKREEKKLAAKEAEQDA